MKLIKKLYKKLTCKHPNITTQRDDGQIHISYCPDCDTTFRIWKVWSLWK